jgi:dipeptidyl aminopeptidase/acylaminoacyl peptidase
VASKKGFSVRLRVGLASAAMASVLPAAARAAAPLPLSAILAPPVLRGAQLSPSGRYVGLIETAGGRDRVVVLDVKTSARAPLLAAKAGASVAWLRWKGDGRLLAGTTAPPGPGAGSLEPVQAMVSLDRRGGGAIALAGPIESGEARLSDPMTSDPRHVLISAPGRRGRPSLWKVDVHSGAARFVGADEEDGDDGLPGGAMVVRYDHHGTGAPAAGDPGMVVLGPAGERDKVYALVAPRGPGDGDTTTVRVFDFKSGAMSAPVWPALPYDAQDIVYRSPGQALAGVCYVAETYRCDFEDEGLKSDYARILAELGADHGVTPLSMSEDGRQWLLGVSAPKEPGAYYLFDRTTRALTRVADRFPEIDRSRLASMTAFTFAARDGAEVHGYVTVPAGAGPGPLPTVVMPHGGPEVRDALGYDRWAQALASRGYLVFQANFRGSSGYGRAWTEAGYGEWGGRMQDDLTDGVRALIASGRADPKRICIVGASYGGYAALYGGAVQPDLYRCVVSMAGVADLPSLLAHERDADGLQSGEFQYARAVIGDPATDREKLVRTSPITYAATYRPPVLLLHGERDRSVPLAQSKAMAGALAAAGHPARLIVMPGEGHADWSPDHEEQALAAITAFLKRNLGD